MIGDLLLLLACGLIVAGVTLVSIPAALILSGVVCLVAAVAQMDPSK